MAQTIIVNGVDRSGSIDRKKVVWAQSAYLCEIGAGKLVIDDHVGNIVVPAYKDVTVDQDDCATPRIQTGFTHLKKTSRLKDKPVGIGRSIEIALLDGNELLRRLVIRKVGSETGNRPAESVGDRVEWILASPFLAGLVSDFGAVTYPDVGLSKAKFRGRYPGDVLQGAAKAVNFNPYVRWNAAEGGWELVFRDDNTSTADTCTLSLSNAEGEPNGTTVLPLLPDPEPVLAEDPEDIYSGAYAAHAKRGGIYEIRAATATAYAERDGIIEDADTDDDAITVRDARLFLHQSKDPEHSLPVGVKLTAAQVGLIQAGMRISTHMEHLGPEGWSPARYARILRTKVTQPLGTDEVYHMAMDLSPQEDGPPTATLVQQADGRGAGGGLTLSLPNPVTVGNLLVFACADRGIADPVSPNTSVAKPRWGAGAWTKVPNTTITTDPVAFNDGVAIWVKEADSTESTGFIAQSNSNCAIFEIAVPDAAATIAAITAISETGQTDALTMDIGSLGSPAAGTVAILVLLWNDQVTVYPAGQTMPGVTATGWTIDRYDSAYEGGWITENTPFAVIAHAAGDGSALSAEVTKTALSHFGTAGWCGAAILIEPQ